MLSSVHEDAQRLVDHAAQSYDTRFSLRYSTRPWVAAEDRERVAQSRTVTGTSGYTWSARFSMRDRHLDPARFWQTDQLDRVRDSIIHVMFEGPTALRITFPAVDAAADVADAIGVCFEAVLTESWPISLGMELNRWADSARGIDERLQAETALAMLDDGTEMTTMFAA